jgi:hypothetical protein
MLDWLDWLGLKLGLDHDLLGLLQGYLHLDLADHLALLLEFGVVLDQTLSLFDEVCQDSLKL